MYLCVFTKSSDIIILFHMEQIHKKCSFRNSQYLSGHRIIKIQLKSIKTDLLHDNDRLHITEMVTNILINYILTQLECLFLYFPNLFRDWKDAWAFKRAWCSFSNMAWFKAPLSSDSHPFENPAHGDLISTCMAYTHMDTYAYKHIH